MNSASMLIRSTALWFIPRQNSKRYGKSGRKQPAITPIILSTHLDKDHLHNHFAVNAVNPIDGKKLQTDHAFIRTMRQQNDRICKAHNLSVVNEPKGKGKSYAEWITEKKGGFTWRGVVRSDIDDLLPSVRSLKELLDELSKQGYQIHTKKYISVSPPGTKSFFRLHKLGAGYSLLPVSAAPAYRLKAAAETDAGAGAKRCKMCVGICSGFTNASG